MLTLKLDLSPWIKLTDDQFYELCQHHPDYTAYSVVREVHYKALLLVHCYVGCVAAHV